MRPVFTYTDFGSEGPYLGQVEAGVHRYAPAAPVYTLLADAPLADPRRASYLLAALTGELPDDAVIVAVVDPGVGGSRLPLLVDVDGRTLIGPDNGLLALAARFGSDVTARVIDWVPQRLSATFHGRDLFAPVAGLVSGGRRPPCRELSPGELQGCQWPADLHEIIYLDRFGNAFTGIRADGVEVTATIEVAGVQLQRANTYSEVPPGGLFWYRNSCGLVELAANAASVAAELGLRPGARVRVHDAPV